jgi:2-isopropylmalate synthase
VTGVDRAAVTARYRPFPAIPLHDRRWPGRSIERAPQWCSVDLRDGNQALVEPMGPQRKRRMFELLVRLGFTEIEVGFPSASQPDFEFVRELIEERLIPEHVTVQVLTQARDELIDRTFEALAGAPRAIVHVYNATSPLFRRVVFATDEAGVVQVAVRAVQRIKECARDVSGRTEVRLEYSPETFSATELPVSQAVCEAVLDAWDPAPGERVILNLPATVEMASPNVYADQIEWLVRTMRGRERATISLHPHNDRGTAVAATELALMAGADRVEGTLFGNGERTGNVDLITLALNLQSQGIDPHLDLSDVPEIVRIAEECTRLPVHPRHPYAGELVFTAFSGSHQDAIKKGFAALDPARWEIPYLPIDPKDIGRSYEAVVRVNSQSGKGGVSYLLAASRGLDLPRGLQIALSRIVQKRAEESGGEIGAEEIAALFEAAFVRPGPLRLVAYETTNEGVAGTPCTIDVMLSDGVAQRAVLGDGIGPIDAFVDALRRAFGLALHVRDFHEHALREGEDAAAAAYVECEVGTARRWGAGIDPNIVTASLSAVLAAASSAIGALDHPTSRKEDREALAVR